MGGVVKANRRLILPRPAVLATLPPRNSLSIAGTPDYMRSVCVGLLLAATAGCNFAPAGPGYAPSAVPIEPQVVYQNPTLVPVSDSEFAWNQIVDVVDDYFKIEREVRPRQAGDIVTEGRIDTFPRTGSTLLEPWNTDSVNGYERLESTLQSIRRRAYIAVRPASGGYLIDVAVMKELEDLEQPERATAGAATFRYDNSVNQTSQTSPRDQGGDGRDAIGNLPRAVGNQTATAGWIPLGRDTALEQVMIAQFQGRFGQMVLPGAAPVFAQPQQILPQPY